MSGDDLLDALAKRARDEDDELSARVDEEWKPWEKLARGEPDATLTDPERREAFAPLDPDPLTDAALTAFGDARDEARETEARTERHAPVVPLRRWIGGGALALAAAAAIALVVLPGGETGLGPYQLAVSGGDQELRGEVDSSEVRLSPGSRIELVLRPERPGPAPNVRTYLSREGERERWTVTPEIDERGAVRIVGIATDLFGERRGRWRIEVELRSPEGGPEQILATDIELVDGDP